MLDPKPTFEAETSTAVDSAKQSPDTMKTQSNANLIATSHDNSLDVIDLTVNRDSLTNSRSATPGSSRDNEVRVHQVDLMVTSRVGLHAMLEQMGENHGFRTKIVNRVYKESTNLEETDKVLHVMREAAQERGEREIRRRSKKRKTA
ncbi:hypothetical protein J3R83DRAFT_629 [Lanmaoa asiatica]|nr:hypothetical protein J3R83DRAFT_629 [Lanmaoa asiatica]